MAATIKRFLSGNLGMGLDNKYDGVFAFNNFSRRQFIKSKFCYDDNTPDSIDYTIVKFIDGGIVSQSVSKLVTDKKSTDRKDGIKLKFQCQNVKKPFEIIVGLDEKMSIAMMKYAEHLEMTVDKLKFQFDGDLISGKDTARALELEGGECIDVKITS